MTDSAVFDDLPIGQRCGDEMATRDISRPPRGYIPPNLNGVPPNRTLGNTP